jgi:hypothetical protein
MKGLNWIMNKRVLMVTFSMALVVGLAGAVNAATMGSNITDTPSQASTVSADVNHNNLSSKGAALGTTSEPDQTLPDHMTQELTAQMTATQPSQSDQTSPSQTDVNTRMESSNASMNNQIQTMPVNTQMQTMPMSTPMNGQMSNSQTQQGMNGTNRATKANASSVTHQSGEKSSDNTMMGSTGRMGR